MKDEKIEDDVNPSSKILKMDLDKDKENENENKNENKTLESELPSILNQQEEETSFKVIYNKNKYDISFPLNCTVMQLKSHLQNIIGM